MKVNLTELERKMVVDSMRFVEAGEWPWELDDAARQSREIAAFERALEKLDPPRVGDATWTCEALLAVVTQQNTVEACAECNCDNPPALHAAANQLDREGVWWPGQSPPGSLYRLAAHEIERLARSAGELVNS